MTYLKNLVRIYARSLFRIISYSMGMQISKVKTDKLGGCKLTCVKVLCFDLMTIVVQVEVEIFFA